MCGLAGIVDFTGRDVDPGLIERMRGTLVRRGPDDQQHTVRREATLASGLAFCRLAVIDLSPLGCQPMHSADGRISLIFNGEIYNHHELRRELEQEGARFRSRSDTEVLVELLARHWTAAPARLRGMFAFAAVDHGRGAVLLARDRLGKKPLLYRLDQGRLWFASELRALLVDPEIPREIDPAALAEYIRYQCVPAPATILRGVRKLMPGTWMEFGRDGTRQERYWAPSFRPGIAIAVPDAVAEVRRRVEDAVRCRLETDVPLGAFLSGGIDSSLVTATMARLLGEPVRTFSIGFEEAAYDERRYAREVAKQFGTEHHEFVVRLEEASLLPEIAGAYDEPFGDSSALPTYLISRLTRQHVTVAMSGDGGDEVFAGYERYAANVLASRVSRVASLAPVRAVGDAMFSRIPAPPKTRRRAAVRLWEGVAIPDAGARYARWMSTADRETLDAIAGPALRSAEVDRCRLERLYESEPELGALDRMQRADLLTYLPDDLLVKVDRASMANSLEVRSPLLDHHLIDFVTSLPESVRAPRLRLKALLKAAFPELPRTIVQRRKMGFGVPIGAWFRGELGTQYRDLVLAPDARSRQWFDAGRLGVLLDQHRAATADHAPLLWTVLMFEHWHRTYLG